MGASGNVLALSDMTQQKRCKISPDRIKLFYLIIEVAAVWAYL
jgi:hypothetical protein